MSQKLRILRIVLAVTTQQVFAQTPILFDVDELLKLDR